MKRKAEAEALPASLVQEPAGTSGTGPFAVYFPSRFDPTGDIACEWQAYGHTNRRNQYVVVARTDSKADFVGSTANPEYSGVLPCRYALGLFSRRRGSVKVMPLEGGKVLRLEPRVHGQQYDAQDVATVPEEARRKEANEALVAEFGSQRRRSQLRAREAARVEARHVSAAKAVLGLIADADAASGGVTKEELVQASLAARNIPPHHRDARVATDAYRSDEIVPPFLRDALEITKLFPAENKPEYRAQLRDSGMFGGGYVLTRLPLLAAPSAALREDRARMLALLGHLLKLLLPCHAVLSVGPQGPEGLAAKISMAPGVLDGVQRLFYEEELVRQDGGRRLVLTPPPPPPTPATARPPTRLQQGEAHPDAQLGAGAGGAGGSGLLPGARAAAGAGDRAAHAAGGGGAALPRAGLRQLRRQLGARPRVQAQAQLQGHAAAAVGGGQDAGRLLPRPEARAQALTRHARRTRASSPPAARPRLRRPAHARARRRPAPRRWCVQRRAV